MVLNDSLLMVILQHDSGHILEKQDMCALWLKREYFSKFRAI